MNPQRSEGWFQERAGRVTASRFAEAIATKRVLLSESEEVVETNGKPRIKRVKHYGEASTDTRKRYLRDIVAELLSGQSKPESSGKALAWGRSVEAQARAAYELETGRMVVDAPFLLHPDFDFIGASPDGLIGDDGGIEIKCPHDMQVHIDTLQHGMPDDHMAQVQGGMFVTGRAWWDFVSYDPRQAEPYRLYIQRIARDPAYIATLQDGLIRFWGEVQEAVATLKQKTANNEREGA